MATGASLLDLVPPSGHGHLFDLILGRLRLQDFQVGCLMPVAHARERAVRWTFLRAGPAPLLQATARCSCRRTSEVLEVRRRAWSCLQHSCLQRGLYIMEMQLAGLLSALVPLHPAFSSLDVRQALVAQQLLHSNIFSSSSRLRPEHIGEYPGRFVVPDTRFQLAAQACLTPGKPGLQLRPLSAYQVREHTAPAL